MCQMQISESGDIEGFEFHKAIIRSHAKLAYAAVDRCVTGNMTPRLAYSFSYPSTDQGFNQWTWDMREQVTDSNIRVVQSPRD